MEVSLKSNIDIKNIRSEVLAFGLFEDEAKLPSFVEKIDSKINKQISFLLSKKIFIPKAGQSVIITTNGLLPQKYIVLLGFGKRIKFDLEAIRIVSAEIVKQTKKIKEKSVAFLSFPLNSVIGNSPFDALKTFFETLFLRNHILKNYKSAKKDDFEKEIQVDSFVLFSDETDMKVFNNALSVARIFANAANKTRDFVNMPSNFLTPKVFSEEAKKICSASKLKLKIINFNEIKRLKMGAIWGVGKGSNNLPVVLLIEWNGAKTNSKPMALIGKGVTFDSGGISLKPSKKMDEMKEDMAGAAAVLFAMEAISKMKLKKNVFAVIPLVENMPSGGALKPGDIVETMSGKTVEIISTDAEGRLILADAITYAKKLGAEKILDFATLTGACIVALGDIASAIIGNNKEFIEKIIFNAEKSGERLWQLPLYEEYREYLKSEIADIKNCSDLGKAGTSTGAIFLKEFVGDTTWAHVDIAGTAVIDREIRHLPKGPTGSGVFTTLNYILNS